MKLFKSNFSFFRCLLAVASIFFITSCSSPDEEHLSTNRSSSAKTSDDTYVKIANAFSIYQHGWASDQSIDTPELNITWQTDCYPKDDELFINAITMYHNWNKVTRKGMNLNPKDYTTQPAPTAAVLQSMRDVFKNSGYYAKNQKISPMIDAIVNQIIKKYGNWFEVSKGNVTIPSSKNKVLEFLRIRSMCAEFVHRIVHSVDKTLTVPSHTTYEKYKDYIVKDESKIKAGMLLVWKTQTHIAGIQSVKRDIKGKLYIQIVESNWGSGWSNPSGQAPWERTISVRQSLYTDKVNGKEITKGTFNLSDYYVIALDKQ